MVDYNILLRELNFNYFFFFCSQLWVLVINKKLQNYVKLLVSLRFAPFNMPLEKNSVPKLENQEDCKVSLLDLPEGTLNIYQPGNIYIYIDGRFHVNVSPSVSQFYMQLQATAIIFIKQIKNHQFAPVLYRITRGQLLDGCYL